jgi:hypothetical protein
VDGFFGMGWRERSNFRTPSFWETLEEATFFIELRTIGPSKLIIGEMHPEFLIDEFTYTGVIREVNLYLNILLPLPNILYSDKRMDHSY